MAAIATRGLTRLYRNGRGIRDVTLQVEPGEVFGFLGPNGAGKTTLIRVLLGFLHPDGGQAEVLGLDAVRQSREVRARVGYLPSDPALYEFLTGRQNVEFALRVRGAAGGGRVREIADALEIDLDRRVKSLSRGNKQKVAILAALAHDPELLILDEPTSGLDPLVQERFHALLRAERARGKTIFMSSHMMAEVESLCDRVAIIRDGRIAAVSGVEQLRKQRVKYVSCRFAGSAPDLSGVAGVRDYQADGERVRLTLAGELPPLLAALAAQPVVDLTVTDPPLDEVFRAFYTGGAA